MIVGSVDGNRLWGKELGIELCFLEWSPDGRNLLFGTLDHKVNIYDSAGNYISKVSLRTDDKLPLIGLEWSAACTAAATFARAARAHACARSAAARRARAQV